MFWFFRRPETPPDASERHQAILDLIEQLATLRGRVSSMETEWLDVKDQVRKSYQRIEKAAERLEKATKKPDEWDAIDIDEAPEVPQAPEPHGFAKKYKDLNLG